MQSLTERQKQYIRRLKGIKKPFSLDTAPAPIKKVREFNAPMVQGFIPCKPRGRSHIRLSHEKRSAILAAAFARHAARQAFFAELEA